jgi:hypothetical protein
MSDVCLRLSPPQSSKQYTDRAEHRVIDPVAGSPIDSHLAQTLAKWFAVAKVPGSEAVDPDCDSCLCASIRQSRKPIIKHVFPSAGNVVANLDHISECNL